jgi:DNA-binding transcriptional LysR family regulator
MDVPIGSLRIFVIICEVGSLTQASRILKVTQPAVSTRIIRLEKMLKVVLFERSVNGVVLTAKGQSILKMAKQILDLHDRMLAIKNEPTRGHGIS